MAAGGVSAAKDADGGRAAVSTIQRRSVCPRRHRLRWRIGVRFAWGSRAVVSFLPPPPPPPPPPHPTPPPPPPTPPPPPRNAAWRATICGLCMRGRLRALLTEKPRDGAFGSMQTKSSPRDELALEATRQ